MKYEELIGVLRCTSTEVDACRDCTHCIEAANAIETLLMKLDTAIEMMSGKCCFCKHTEKCKENEQYVTECANDSDWEWCDLQNLIKLFLIKKVQ